MAMDTDQQASLRMQTNLVILQETVELTVLALDCSYEKIIWLCRVMGFYSRIVL